MLHCHWLEAVRFQAAQLLDTPMPSSTNAQTKPQKCDNCDCGDKIDFPATEVLLLFRIAKEICMKLLLEGI